MTIDFTAYFTKFGHFAGEAKSIIDAVKAGTYRDDWRSALAELARAAKRHLIRTVQTDAPGDGSLEYSCRELVRQMESESETVDGTTVSVAIAYAAGNTGTGALIVSVDAVDGNDWPYLHGKLDLECIADAQVSGDLRDVRFAVRGDQAVDRLSPEWPRGNGLAATIQLTSNAEQQFALIGKQILREGGFEQFATANVPSGWAQTSGTPGTHFASQAGLAILQGDSGFKWIGDGAVNPKLRERINLNTGTLGKLRPRRPYAQSVWLRDDGTPPAAGDAEYSLEDSGASVQYNSALQVDLTALTSTFENFANVFFTPAAPLAEIYAVMETTTAIESGREVFQDDYIIAAMYSLGREVRDEAVAPHVLVVPGAANWVVGDRITVTFTNNDEGLIVHWFERLIGISHFAIQLPGDYGGTETIADSLVI